MLIIELEKEELKAAREICELAEESILIEEPHSFSSDLNTIIQIGVELAPYAISAVTMIIIELLKNKKKVKMKISKDGSIELEGFSEEKTIELADKYLKEMKEDKAKDTISKLLSDSMGKKNG